MCAGLALLLDVRWPELLIAVGALIVTPLALLSVDAPARDGSRSHLMRAVRFLHLPCALALALALVLAAGTAAALLTVPWAVFTGLVALLGATRLLARGVVPLEELVIDAGLVQLAIGGTWLLASRADWQLLGFDATWVVLTAAHFHFAGLALSVLAGVHGRSRPLRRLVGWTFVLGPPGVALGITLSHSFEATSLGTLAHGVEVAASWALALAALAFAILQGQAAVTDRTARTRIERLARLWLGVSSASLACGMGLALAYSLGRFLHWPRPTIGDLLDSHAPLNAIGFALFGIVARAMRPVDARRPDVRPALASLPSPGRVALPFFSGDTATGLVDTLDRYGTLAAHPEVRRFYERTTELELTVRPTWRPLFVPAARIFIALARKMIGNLVLPLPGSAPERVRSRIVALADDGPRVARRGSERRYEDGRPMYVAAYAVHGHDGVGYMNIALPLPRATMTSILRMDVHEIHGAIRLTSIPHRDRPGDEGIHLRVGPLLVALPLSEELELFPRAAAPSVPDFATEETTLVARHVFRVFGVVCLELDYAIAPLTVGARSG